MSKQPASETAQAAVGAKKEPVKSLVSMPSNKRLNFFQDYAPQISMLIPTGSDLNPARIVNLAVQLTADIKIQNCTAQSVLGAIMQSVILGFEPIPGLGLAAFIPYGDKLHFQIEYKGYLDLLYRTGMYDAIYAEVVRDGDEFDYWLGVDPGILHKPKDYKGKLTHVYAVARLKGSSIPIFRVLTKEEVYEIRDHYSQAYRSGKKDSPWFGIREAEMWKKTAILQLQKSLPKSITIQKAAVTDEKAVDIEDFDTKTKEIDYSKLPIAEVLPEKQPEIEQKPAAEARSPEENVSAPPKEEKTEENTVKCVRCGQLYHPRNISEANEHLTCIAVKPVQEEVPVGVKVNDPYAETPAMDLPLAKAFPQAEAVRKIKYIREEFHNYKELFISEGISNLQDFCRKYEIEMLTGFEVTVGIYEAMKADIAAVKKKYRKS